MQARIKRCLRYQPWKTGDTLLTRIVAGHMLVVALSGCINPPFNDFHPTPSHFLHALTQPGQKALIRTLNKEDIQFVEYGDTMTLVVPTDHYFMKNSAEINDICYDGLNNVVKLLKHYPECPIYVAAFTDDMGTLKHKINLSKARAEAMLTFLWASHIPAHDLHASGYADKFAIGDNQLIHGAAYNRRIEIQWSKLCAERRIVESMNINPAEMKK